MADFEVLRVWLSSFMSSLLALPFSGGVARLILRALSSRPLMAVREEPGTTLTAKRMPFLEDLICKAMLIL